MYTKYITTLNLMDNVIALKGEKRDEAGNHPCEAAWDVLFTYIHANFAEPATSSNLPATDADTIKFEYERCREVLLNNAVDNGAALGALEVAIRTIPPVILDIVLPVAIARLLLSAKGQYALPICHRNLATFTELHVRYGRMILADSLSYSYYYNS